MPGDASAVKGVRLNWSSLRRVWRFASPYRWAIGGFLAAIVAAALIALIPPFVFRTIIDRAIPDGNRGCCCGV